jgi:hypothetical protein
MDLHIPSLAEIRRALHLQERLENLRAELAEIFGGGTGKRRGRKPGRKPGPRAVLASGDEAAVVPAPAKRGRGRKKAKRVLSPEAREKIAAAQRRRWAKQKRKQA